MSAHECTLDTLIWVWGNIVKCDVCGNRYDSPGEAEALRDD